MSARFLGVVAVSAVLLVVVVRLMVGESRFVAAQHRAYRSWDATGEAVPGWSPVWIWSWPRCVFVPVAGPVVKAVASVVRVAGLYVAGRPQRPVQGGPAGAGRVVEGRVVPSAPVASRARSRALVGARGGEGS